jgi:hypothetical protein
MQLIFLDIPTLPILTIMINMDQMILSEPSIIFIWTYQEMMEWMSRILVGEMAGLDEDYLAGSWAMWLISLTLTSQLNQDHHDQRGPDDPFRTINYLHLDISGHDEMDEHDIGWRNGWC